MSQIPLNFFTTLAPSGVVLDYAGTTAPDGWLLCFGQTLNIADYPNLFEALGTTYGGNGTTTFNLPDYRGRVTVGKDNMGGSAANRITSAGSGITGTTLGAAGGAQTHTLTEAQLASHTHTQNSHDHGLGDDNGVQSFVSSGVQGTGGVLGPNVTGTPFNYLYYKTAGKAATNQNTGSGSAHQNTQPSIITNKIIKV